MAEDSPLREAYRRWQAAQAVQAAPSGVTPGQRGLSARLAKVAAEDAVRQIAQAVDATRVEAKAFRRSVKRVARAADNGTRADAALLYGFRHYRKKGGSASFPTWRRRVAGGGR